MGTIPVFIDSISIWRINPYHYETGVRVGNAAINSDNYAKRKIVCQERRIHFTVILGAFWIHPAKKRTCMIEFWNIHWIIVLLSNFHDKANFVYMMPVNVYNSLTL